MRKLLIFAFLTSSFFAFAQLKPIEQEILDEINLVRTNPEDYVQYIDEFLDFWSSGEGERKTAEELKNVLSNMQPLAPLKYSEDLYKSCQQHANYLKRTKKFEHSKTTNAENIQYGNESARFAVIDLLIDHGVADRGHRKNLLNPIFRYFGVYYIEKVDDDYLHLFVQQFR
ncbi:MAG: hypothetical protein JXR36_01120 [Bacteroidales bacterium]|nr:hypothetical protein [Bacteroidales bacterium]